MQYYLRERDYGSTYPVILDEDGMEAARCGENKWNPDEFVELCKAESYYEALQVYYDDVEACSGDNIRPGAVDCMRDLVRDVG